MLVKVFLTWWMMYKALMLIFWLLLLIRCVGPQALVLYSKSEPLSAMPPSLGGGEMISDVYLYHSTYAEPPSRTDASKLWKNVVLILVILVDIMEELNSRQITTLKEIVMFKDIGSG